MGSYNFNIFYHLGYNLLQLETFWIFLNFLSQCILTLALLNEFTWNLSLLSMSCTKIETKALVEFIYFIVKKIITIAVFGIFFLKIITIVVFKGERVKWAHI